MNNDLNLNKVDTLGALLAQIADLKEEAEVIKDSIKEMGASGLLPKKSNGKIEVQFLEGALFSATYVECDKTIFDQKKFIAEFGEETYKKYTRTTAVFSVKVTSR
jgi:hypothetical protein